MEEQVISHTQYLDLFYTQSSTLYKKILSLPLPTSEPIIVSLQDRDLMLLMVL